MHSIEGLAQGLKHLSGRRGSNSRHSAWKADALPTELLPQKKNNKTMPLGDSGDKINTSRLDMQ